MPYQGSSLTWQLQWNAAIAAYNFVAKVGNWMLHHTPLGKLANQAAMTLKIAGAILWALQQVLNYLKGLVTASLSPVLGAVDNAMQGYYDPLWGDLNATYVRVGSGLQVPPSEARALWKDVGSEPLVVTLGIGTAMEVV